MEIPTAIGWCKTWLGWIELISKCHQASVFFMPPWRVHRRDSLIGASWIISSALGSLGSGFDFPPSRMLRWSVATNPLKSPWNYLTMRRHHFSHRLGHRDSPWLLSWLKYVDIRKTSGFSASKLWRSMGLEGPWNERTFTVMVCTWEVLPRQSGC